MTAKAKQLADGRWECQGCLSKFTCHKRDKKHPDGWTTPPKFCKPGCRKRFHLEDGMSFRKLQVIVNGILKKEIHVFVAEAYEPLRLAIEQLRARMAEHELSAHPKSRNGVSRTIRQKKETES